MSNATTKSIIIVSASQSSMLEKFNDINSKIREFNADLPKNERIASISDKVASDKAKYKVSKTGKITLEEHGFSMSFGTCDNSLILTINKDCIIEIFGNGGNGKLNTLVALDKKGTGKGKSTTTSIGLYEKFKQVGIDYLKALRLDARNMDKMVATYKLKLYKTVLNWLLSPVAKIVLSDEYDEIVEDWKSLTK